MRPRRTSALLVSHRWPPAVRQTPLARLSSGWEEMRGLGHHSQVSKARPGAPDVGLNTSNKSAAAFFGMAPGWARDVDFGWEGRKVGQGGEEVVGLVKKVDLGVAVAFGDCEEYAGLALGA